ncbi:MAG: hypothetical protein JNM85_06345 [Chthonomonas sp.]|nr:hypothetical protein [Chthonomonas sp.]
MRFGRAALTLGLCVSGLPLAAQEPPAAYMMELRSAGQTETRALLRIDNTKLNPPQKSPKNEWIFEYIVSGYGRLVPGSPLNLRFRIFSQYRSSKNDLAISASRMLMRLWEFNIDKLRLDHTEATMKFVDLYLCYGGKAGGEQLFDKEMRQGMAAMVNTMYIYDVTSFTDPLEMAREIAHEYGHATLPPVGGFVEPEEWANGYLGEKLYLSWLAEELESERLGSNDAMGAPLDRIQAWVTANVDPLAKAVRDQGPNRALLVRKTKAAMDAYLGVALWVERVMPSEMFSRSMVLNTSESATGFAKSAAEVASEQKWEYSGASIGSKIWLPVGTAKLKGAKVLKLVEGWAQVQVTAPKVEITPR